MKKTKTVDPKVQFRRSKEWKTFRNKIKKKHNKMVFPENTFIFLTIMSY